MMGVVIRLGVALSCAAYLSFATGGCGQLGPDPAAAEELILAEGTESTEAPADPEPTDPEPPADEEAPAPDEEEPDEGDSGGSGSNLVLIAIVALVAVGLAVVLFRPRGSASYAPRRSAPVRPHPVRAPGIALDDRVAGDISWLNEQLSLDLLAAEPEVAAERWRVERPRIEQLARDCQRLEESTANSGWGALAAGVSGLAQALDTAVSARLGNGVDPSVTHQAIELVNHRRSQLAGLVAQVRREH